MNIEITFRRGKLLLTVFVISHSLEYWIDKMLPRRYKHKKLSIKEKIDVIDIDYWKTIEWMRSLLKNLSNVWK